MTKEEALEYLRDLLPPGSTVYTVLRHVSKSGMTRWIDCYVLYCKDGKARRRWISGAVAKATERTLDRRYDSVKIGGCGMDMGFALVYALGWALYPDCGANSDFGYVTGRNGSAAPETNGGYFLEHEWL